MPHAAGKGEHAQAHQDQQSGGIPQEDAEGPGEVVRVGRYAGPGQRLHSAGRTARFAQPALVNGAVGAVVVPHGRPLSVMAFTVSHGKIAEIEIIADPARLRELDLAVLAD
jgi:hypothetical protein